MRSRVPKPFSEENLSKAADIHREYEDCLNRGDMDGLVALYAPNAVLIPGPGEVARGAIEIRAALARFFAYKPTIRIETAAAYENGDMALLHGKWILTGTGLDRKPLEMRAVSAEVVQRQADGKWLYVIDNPFAG